MPAVLEDELGDILGKARRGQELELNAVAAAAGLSPEEVARAEACQWLPPAEAVAALALALGLGQEALVGAARQGFWPERPGGRPLADLRVTMLELRQGYAVNGYLIVDRASDAALLVDPGADASAILAAITAASARVQRVVLTHGHHDHTGALAEVCRATGARAHVGAGDLAALGPLREWVDSVVTDGQQLTVGAQTLAVRAVPGHTEGGIWLVHPEAAWVGDAVFAGSLGRTSCRRDYFLLRTRARQLLTELAPTACVFPGHGPATTAGEELHHNPFLA
jgi:glyoxylase-like metal-dependent hydrolase (beta-lactamase superfamily II)